MRETLLHETTANLFSSGRGKVELSESRSRFSKKGHYEWEDFGRELISSIAEWENQHGNDGPGWDYYKRWLVALERLLIESELLKYQELESRTKELLTLNEEPHDLAG